MKHTLRNMRKFLRESIEAQETKNAALEMQLEKSRAEWEKRHKELNELMGKLGQTQGAYVEAMFVNLGAKFNELGYSFPGEAAGYIYRDADRKCVAEVDRLCENGESVLAVEVKAKLKQDHVDAHIERLGRISRHMKSKGDGRKVLGAVAGGVVPEHLQAYAQKKGLFVLVQSGESVALAALPEGFVPKEW